MRAEAATVGDAESSSSGDNDMSDEDSENTQSHSSELLFSLCIACKQVRQCHECYSESNGTIPELRAAFKKSHEVFVYGGSTLHSGSNIVHIPYNYFRYYVTFVTFRSKYHRTHSGHYVISRLSCCVDMAGGHRSSLVTVHRIVFALCTCMLALCCEQLFHAVVHFKEIKILRPGVLPIVHFWENILSK